MKRITSILVCLAFIGLSVYGQDIQITGKVTSADDGSALPGVSVVIKGTQKGVSTNVDGNYSITAPSDATLVFTSVGMESQEVLVGGQTVIDVEMISEQYEVAEVVVTALGITKDVKSLGYSATMVSEEEIQSSGESTLMNSMQGRVAGVQISSGGGMPGASTKVIIRGYSSITRENNALYIVDGVPINNSTYADYRDGLNFGNGANALNPDDVESVSILKGAAATAIYGSRAANGAVVITTKSGKTNQKMVVDLSSSYTLSKPLRLPQMQNMFGQGWNGHFAYEENGSWGPALDGELRLWGNEVDGTQQVKPFEAQENNLADFYDVGTSFTNNVSIRGGSEKATFFASYGNTQQDGMVPTDVDSYVRNNLTFKGSLEGKLLTISPKVSYIRTTGSNTPDGYGGTNAASNLYSELLQVPRDFSIVDMEDYEGDFYNVDNFYTPYATNPYYSINKNRSEYFIDRVQGNLLTELRLTDFLSVNWNLSTDVSNFSRKEWEAITEFSPGSPNDLRGATANPGVTVEERVFRREFNSDLILKFYKQFASEISLDAIVGHNVYQYDYKDISASISSLVIPEFYNLANTDGTKEATTYESQKRAQSVYGQATVGYKDLAYFTFTGRNDWSSTLPKGENSFFYPAVNASFVFSELDVLNSDILSFAKLRVAWGKAGNDANVYQVYSTIDPAVVWYPFAPSPSYGYVFPVNGVPGYELSNLIGNPELKPEITTESEIGIDLRFLQNRIGIDFAYYDKLTDGQILRADIAPSSGYLWQTKNFGSISNKGIELNVNLVPVKMAKLVWEIGVNYTKNKNEVVKLEEGVDEVQIHAVYNTRIVAVPGEPIGTIKVPEIAYTDDGRAIVNPDNGFPETTGSEVIIGDINPDYMLGITNTFTIFNDLRFGFIFDFQKGGVMYSGTADLHYFAGNATQTLYNERQTFLIPNSVNEVGEDADGNPIYVENTTPITVANNNNPLYYPSYNLASEADRVIDRSYVKLRQVNLTYTIPSKWIAPLKLQAASISVIGRNLLLWTPEENNFVDPETTSFGNDLRGSFGEFRTGPTPRSINFSLNLTF